MSVSATATIVVVRTAGLAPPPGSPAAPWPWWHEAGTGRPPEVLRFAWCPRSGRLWAGASADHRLLLTREERSDVRPVLLGYSFPVIRCLAVKGIYADAAAAVGVPGDDDPARRFLRALRPALAPGDATFADVNSPFLWQRLGRPRR